MAQIIEIQHPSSCSSLSVNEGDVMLFRGTGGRVRSDYEVVEFLGAFVAAVVGDNGEVFAPVGPPNAVLFRARHPGRATIDVVSGDPFHTPKTTSLTIHVEA